MLMLCGLLDYSDHLGLIGLVSISNFLRLLQALVRVGGVSSNLLKLVDGGSGLGGLAA